MTPTTDDVAGLVAQLRQKADWRPDDVHGHLHAVAANTIESQAKALREAEAEAERDSLCAAYAEISKIVGYRGDEEHSCADTVRAVVASALAAEARLKEAEKVLAFWSHEGSLQTLEDRERFRSHARAFLNAGEK